MKKKILKITGLCVTILILFCLSLFVCYRISYKYVQKNLPETASIKNFKIDTSAKTMKEANKQLVDREVFFAGIQDGALAKSSPILLKNPDSNNDIFMMYTILDEDTGNVIYETDLIKAGCAVEWVPGEILGVGEHHLIFSEQPYYCMDTNQVLSKDTLLPLVTGNNSVTIQVVD